MRSEVRFFMHPDDEVLFVSWVSPTAVVDLGRGYITHLRGRYALADDTGSIQFWRSQLQEGVLTEGRIALATTRFGLEERLPLTLVTESEELFGRLKRQIKKNYINGLVRWWNPLLPAGPTNPTKLDRAVWLGPGALRWWKSAPGHKLKNLLQSPAEVIRSEEDQHLRSGA